MFLRKIYWNLERSDYATTTDFIDPVFCVYGQSLPHKILWENHRLWMIRLKLLGLCRGIIDKLVVLTQRMQTILDKKLYDQISHFPTEMFMIYLSQLHF